MDVCVHSFAAIGSTSLGDLKSSLLSAVIVCLFAGMESVRYVVKWNFVITEKNYLDHQHLHCNQAQIEEACTVLLSLDARYQALFPDELLKFRLLVSC